MYLTEFHIQLNMTSLMKKSPTSSRINKAEQATWNSPWHVTYGFPPLKLLFHLNSLK